MFTQRQFKPYRHKMFDWSLNPPSNQFKPPLQNNHVCFRRRTIVRKEIR
jgi:hypothetical protein